MADCEVLARDLAFVVQTCPEIFDFGLPFELLIFGILPSCLVIAAAVIAGWQMKKKKKKKKKEKRCASHTIAVSVLCFLHRLYSL
jgi:hypothetical protein